MLAEDIAPSRLDKAKQIITRIIKNLGRVLDVKDLIDDAENTFIKDEENEDVQLIDIRNEIENN